MVEIGGRYRGRKWWKHEEDTEEGSGGNMRKIQRKEVVET